MSDFIAYLCMDGNSHLLPDATIETLHYINSDITDYSFLPENIGLFVLNIDCVNDKIKVPEHVKNVKIEYEDEKKFKFIPDVDTLILEKWPTLDFLPKIRKLEIYGSIERAHCESINFLPLGLEHLVLSTGITENPINLMNLPLTTHTLELFEINTTIPPQIKTLIVDKISTDLPETVENVILKKNLFSDWKELDNFKRKYPEIKFTCL